MQPSRKADPARSETATTASLSQLFLLHTAIMGISRTLAPRYATKSQTPTALAPTEDIRRKCMETPGSLAAVSRHAWGGEKNKRAENVAFAPAGSTSGGRRDEMLIPKTKAFYNVAFPGCQTRLPPPRRNAAAAAAAPAGLEGGTGGQRGARAGGRPRVPRRSRGRGCSRAGAERLQRRRPRRGSADISGAAGRRRGPAGGQRPPPLGRVQRGRAEGLRAAPAGASRRGDTGSAEPQEFAISVNSAVKTFRVLEVCCSTCDKAPCKAFTARCRRSEPVSLGLAPASRYKGKGKDSVRSVRTYTGCGGLTHFPSGQPSAISQHILQHKYTLFFISFFYFQMTCRKFSEKTPPS